MRTCSLALLLLALAMSLASARVIAVAGFNNNEVQLAVRDAHPGDEVRFWPGTYTLTDPIVLKPGMILRGAGEESTILQFAGNKAGAVMIAIVGVEQVLERVAQRDQREAGNIDRLQECLLGRFVERFWSGGVVGKGD